MNGTTVMHMFAVTFIATSAGIDVTPANLVVMAFLSICAAAGTPADPDCGNYDDLYRAVGDGVDHGCLV